MANASCPLFQTFPCSPAIGEWRELAEILRVTTGIDLANYRAAQTARRLEHIAAQQDLSPAGLTQACRENPDRSARLLHDLLIQTTQFFRDPELWNSLQEAVLPALIGGRGRLRVWAAACANGSEAYSLAAVLHHVSGIEHEVLATDIDPAALEHARAGAYSRAQARSIPSPILKEYFESANGGVRVKSALARQITFKTHDLLGPTPPGKFDMISCRNVAIYFADAARDSLFRRLSASLNPGGVLFLGATERIFWTQDLGLRPISPYLYVRS